MLSNDDCQIVLASASLSVQRSRIRPVAKVEFHSESQESPQMCQNLARIILEIDIIC